MAARRSPRGPGEYGPRSPRAGQGELLSPHGWYALGGAAAVGVGLYALYRGGYLSGEKKREAIIYENAENLPKGRHRHAQIKVLATAEDVKQERGEGKHHIFYTTSSFDEKLLANFIKQRLKPPSKKSERKHSRSEKLDTLHIFVESDNSEVVSQIINFVEKVLRDEGVKFKKVGSKAGGRAAPSTAQSTRQTAQSTPPSTAQSTPPSTAQSTPPSTAQ